MLSGMHKASCCFWEIEGLTWGVFGVPRRNLALEHLFPEASEPEISLGAPPPRIKQMYQ